MPYPPAPGLYNTHTTKCDSQTAVIYTTTELYEHPLTTVAFTGLKLIYNSDLIPNTGNQLINKKFNYCTL